MSERSENERESPSTPNSTTQSRSRTRAQGKVEVLPIAVIIPTYNRLHTLPCAVESVLAQSALPAELCIVDDGSTDDTAEYLQRLSQHLSPPYAETPLRFVHLQQDNAGVSQARNHGIESTKSPWIAFLDSDDTWKPEKLQVQWALAQNHPDRPLIHTEEIWIRNGRFVNPMNKHRKYDGDVFLHCLPLCCISPSSAMLKRQLLDEVGLFDPNLPAGEDYELWLRICSRYQVAFVPEAQLVKTGGHDDQLSQRHWGMDRFRVYALEKLLGDSTLDLQPPKREAARQCLLKKLRILQNGAKKRERHERAAACARKIAFWEAHSEIPDTSPPAPLILS